MTNKDLQEKLKEFPDDEIIMSDIEEWEYENQKITYPVLKFISLGVTIWESARGIESVEK